MSSEHIQTTHFNALTPAEAERLALLAEECGEIIQVVGKILRHGFDSCHPNDPQESTNRELLENELGDLRAAYRLMIRECDINGEKMARAYNRKNRRMGGYLHHQSPAQLARLADPS